MQSTQGKNQISMLFISFSPCLLLLVHPSFPFSVFLSLRPADMHHILDSGAGRVASSDRAGQARPVGRPGGYLADARKSGVEAPGVPPAWVSDRTTATAVHLLLIAKTILKLNGAGHSSSASASASARRPWSLAPQPRRGLLVYHASHCSNGGLPHACRTAIELDFEEQAGSPRRGTPTLQLGGREREREREQDEVMGCWGDDGGGSLGPWRLVFPPLLASSHPEEPADTHY